MADAIQNEIDRTRTYLESHININANIRRSILASVSSILANKEHFDKATVKEMFENLSYSFEVINFANNDIGTIEKVLLAMKENNESYRYDLRLNLSENPWQVYYVLEKQIPELKKLVASALSERDLAIREYGAFFEKTIPNFNDRFNLLGEMVVKDLKEEFLQNNPIPKNKC